MRTIQKGVLALLFMVVESAFITIALEVGGASIGAVPLLFYSSIAGTLTVLPVAYFLDRCKGLLKILRSRKILAVVIAAGLLDFAISRLMLTFGTLGTTPSISGIVFRTYPLMIAVLTPLALRQKVSARQMLALLLGFASVYIILSGGSILTINMSELPYIILLLAAALTSAISTLMVKRYNTSTSGFIILANVTSFAFILPIIFTLHINIPFSLSLPTLASIIFIGGIESGISALLFYYSYKVLSTSFAGSAVMVIPFLTVLFSSLLLGTQMKPYYFVSAALLALGIFIQGRNSFSAPEHLKSKGVFKRMLILDITGAFANNYSEGLYRYISGRGKALAMRLDGGLRYDDALHGNIFSRRNCIAFTNTAPHADTKKEEINFVNEMLGLGKGETALIGIGNQRDLEEAFEEFATSEGDRSQSPKRL